MYRGTLSGWRGKGQELIAVKTLKGTDKLAEQREYQYANVLLTSQQSADSYINIHCIST